MASNFLTIPIDTWGTVVTPEILEQYGASENRVGGVITNPGDWEFGATTLPGTLLKNCDRVIVIPNPGLFLDRIVK